MYSTRTILRAAAILLPMVLGISVPASVVNDDEVPEVRARVARISYLEGDVQIRRAGATDWETATRDLPVVEGDEVATGRDARVEFQLAVTSHIRVAANSYLKFVTLKDEGVALSLPQGTVTLRLSDFDKDHSFFELDAPKITVAVQRSGRYRIDTGNGNGNVVNISVADSGEARIYSESTGFTLRNGRRATVKIDGAFAGEWEMADAAQYTDAFDQWVLERDDLIAARLKDAYFDTYYDRDIYGAEDLDGAGEWIHTKKYGYVWRPYANTISSYADWSPYRYGQWRWIPPFGWTWVNDEPWGWATYHHGRWFYDAGYWYWSPYGYYRNSRSWWSPALVVVSIISNNICWYPLPYSASYYDFNYYYGGGRHHDRDGNGHWPRPGTAPTPTPTPITGRGRMDRMPYYNVPENGVVTVAKSEFGIDNKGFKKATPTFARSVLARDPSAAAGPVLPKREEIVGRVRPDATTVPVFVRGIDRLKTGAAERKAGSGSADVDIQKRQVLDERIPIRRIQNESTTRGESGGAQLPDTGAVERKEIVPVPQPDPVIRIPRYSLPTVREPKRESPGKSEEPKTEKPGTEDTYIEPPRKSVPRQETPKSDEPRPDPPRQKQEPKADPPTRVTPNEKTEKPVFQDRRNKEG